MVGLLARLARSMPLVIALIVLAAVIYLIVARVHSSARAKEVLIKVFTVLCSGIAVAFALVSLYAVVDGNTAVLELAASFAGVGVVGLAITLICRWRFRENNPNYRRKAEKTTMDPQGTMARKRMFWKIYDFIGRFRDK